LANDPVRLPVLNPHQPRRDTDALNGRKRPNEPRRERPSDDAPGIRFALAIGVAGIALIALGGCRGAAHREVFQQKMAGRIRILEDQLNEADYQNQILADQLARSRNQVVIPENTRGQASAAAKLRPSRPPRPSAGPTRPGAGSPTPSPALPARPLADSPADGGNGDDAPDDDSFVPPQVPIPPGLEDLDFPDVDLGEPVPPAGAQAVPELPPGQIELPAPVQRSSHVEPSVLASLRINQSMSGGYRFDDADEKTGMHLAVEPIDERGQMVSLLDCDTAGTLSVVLLDPTLDPSDARIGRWDFDAEETRSMARSGPGKTLHVYIPWQDKTPAGKQVIAHVRYTAGEAQMQAQAELKTAESEVATWNPRGAMMQR
jgi:hypothetical protein